MWTPTASGTYLIAVTAFDGLFGTEVNTTFWYAVEAPLTAVTAATNPASPQPYNTPITITASANGGTNVEYQFWVYNPSATPAWSQLQAYSATATCVWTPTKPGPYLISITARDSMTGTEVNDVFWYTVNY